MRTVHLDGGVRRSRTLGENDFVMHLGSLQHRLVFRPRFVHLLNRTSLFKNHFSRLLLNSYFSPLMDRQELCHEIILGFLLDLMDGLNNENFLAVAPYRFLKISSQKIMLSLLEGNYIKFLF